jgi:ABC-type anion transport system duplicated permease subunit
MYSVGDELTKFVIRDGTVAFSLDNWWMATMIAEKHSKGDFDTYFFAIDRFIKHANAKGYNRHVQKSIMCLLCMVMAVETAVASEDVVAGSLTY